MIGFKCVHFPKDVILYAVDQKANLPDQILNEQIFHLSSTDRTAALPSAELSEKIDAEFPKQWEMGLP